MQVPSWASIAAVAKSALWYMASPIILNLIVAFGGTVCSKLGINHVQAIVLSMIAASLVGCLLLARASSRQVGIHFAVAALFVPGYYLLLWSLSFLAPIISNETIPGRDVFLVFADPLKPANAAVIALAVPYVLARLVPLRIASIKHKGNS